MSIAHPTPSARARELVQGAYDVHVHVLPDVFERKTTDLDLAYRFKALGMGGFVLKSHYTMTAERASVVRTVSGVDVVGSITLNWGVGGINPVAIEVCARVGGRIVWMPTFDSLNEALSSNNHESTGRPPAWAKMKRELEDKGINREPITVLDAEGRVKPEVRDSLRLIAEHGMVLCTGHLGRDEIIGIVEAARDEGVETIVITHPEFPSQRIPADDQRRLADRGCLLERCFGTPYGGRVEWEVMFANIRAAGPENSVLSSDLGQVYNPPVEDGIALMVDKLLDAGFTENEIHTMAVANTRRVVDAAPAAPTPTSKGG